MLAGSEHLGQATLELAKEWATPLSKGSSAREELLQLLGKAIGLREVRDEAARAAGKALDEDSPAGKDAGEDAASRARNRQEREVAVSAVHFLVAQQQGDGSFQPAGDCPVSSVGLTSLVVLAVLGEGSNTLRRGPHRGVIKQAIIWLRSQQTEDGQFSAGAKGQAGALDHVLATIAMCETHHRSAYRTLKVNAERGRDYLVAHLEPGVELRTWYWLADQAFKSARLKRIDGALQKHDWRGPAAPEIQQIVGVVDMLLAPVPAANSTARQVRGVGKHVEMAKAVLTQGGPALMTCYQAGTAMHAIGGQLAVKWRDTLRNRLSGCQQKSGRFKAARQGTDPVYAAALLTMCVTAAHDGRLGR